MSRLLLRFWTVLFAIIALSIASAGQEAPVQPPPPQPIPPTAQQSPPRAAPAQAPVTPQTADDSAQPAPADTANDQSGMFVFKKQVDEVVLHATVVDASQRLATHLDRNAFAVFEDGAQQTITSFRREDVPVAIGILIDNSGSMRDKREQVNQAVLNLIRASNPHDEIFVVNFGRNPYLDQDFTSDVGLLEQALHKTTTQGSTALYDAIAASLAHLKTNAQLQKKMLLVVTDGRDNMSQATLQDVMRSLQQQNGPALYAIGLMGPNPRSLGRDALQQLADASGGCAFFPANVDQVSEITSALAHDIRSQYTLTYKPKDQHPNGSYHPIQVVAQAASLGKLIVRTRSGYYTGETPR